MKQNAYFRVLAVGEYALNAVLLWIVTMQHSRLGSIKIVLVTWNAEHKAFHLVEPASFFDPKKE